MVLTVGSSSVRQYLPNTLVSIIEVAYIGLETSLSWADVVSLEYGVFPQSDPMTIHTYMPGLRNLGGTPTASNAMPNHDEPCS